MKAFEQKNYLIYYPAQANRIDTFKIIRRTNNDPFYYNMYEISELDKITMENMDEGYVFDQLPIEFKNDYAVFSRLYSAASLHKNAYEAFREAKKIKKVIETDTYEMGITSVDVAISRINDNLHFVYGNFLVVDLFTEFRLPIKELLSYILYRFSEQSKEKLSKSFFYGSREKDITFDEIDFFCLVEYFSSDDIKELMRTNRLEKIPFINMNIIEIAIHNIFEYYDKQPSLSTTCLDMLQHRIKSCLYLFRYMDLSIELIEYVTAILFKHEFREIYISDKLLFIDAQINLHKKFSPQLSKIVFEKLKYYINAEIEQIKSGGRFELYSRNQNLQYCNLSDYLSQHESSISAPLSKITNEIMDTCPTYPLLNLIHFYEHVGMKAKMQIENKILLELTMKYSFKLFSFLVVHRICIPDHIMRDTKAHLQKIVHKKGTDSNGVVINNGSDQHDDLISIGCWCLLGWLEKLDFIEFLGYQDEFDFLMELDEFDHNRISISWLFNYTEIVHKTIAKNTKVKKRIRMLLYNKLKTDSVNTRDADMLMNLLVDHYL